MKQIIVGTGRSGTGYVSACINEMGLRCGHEEKFTPRGLSGSLVQRDASWMAVPYLHAYEDAHRVLVWREPEQVIASFLGINFFTEPSPYLDWQTAHIAAGQGNTPYQRACAHWVIWNDMALKHVDAVMPLHALDWEQLMGDDYSHATVSAALARVSTSTNARRRAQLPASLPGSVHAMRRRLLAASE